MGMSEPTTLVMVPCPLDDYEHPPVNLPLSQATDLPCGGGAVELERADNFGERLWLVTFGAEIVVARCRECGEIHQCVSTEPEASIIEPVWARDEAAVREIVRTQIWDEYGWRETPGAASRDDDRESHREILSIAPAPKKLPEAIGRSYPWAQRAIGGDAEAIPGVYFLVTTPGEGLYPRELDAYASRGEFPPSGPLPRWTNYVTCDDIVESEHVLRLVERGAPGVRPNDRMAPSGVSEACERNEASPSVTTNEPSADGGER